MIESKIEFNGVTINDQVGDQDLSAGKGNGNQYFIKVDTVDGVFGDEIRVETHPIPCGVGERHGPVLRSGKALVRAGRIYGANLAKLREAQWKLMEMFWDLQPHKWLWTPAGYSHRIYYTAYVSQPLVMSDVFGQVDHVVQSWTVGLRADDPRSYSETDDTPDPSWQA